MSPVSRTDGETVDKPREYLRKGKTKAFEAD